MECTALLIQGPKTSKMYPKNAKIIVDNMEWMMDSFVLIVEACRIFDREKFARTIWTNHINTAKGSIRFLLWLSLDFASIVNLLKKNRIFFWVWNIDITNLLDLSHGSQDFVACTALLIQWTIFKKENEYLWGHWTQGLFMECPVLPYEIVKSEKKKKSIKSRMHCAAYTMTYLFFKKEELWGLLIQV